MDLAIALGLYSVCLGLVLVGWQFSRFIKVAEAILDDHKDHRDATEKGMCGSQAPIIVPDKPPVFCELLALHDGWHTKDGMSWSDSPNDPPRYTAAALSRASVESHADSVKDR